MTYSRPSRSRCRFISSLSKLISRPLIARMRARTVGTITARSPVCCWTNWTSACLPVNQKQQACYDNQNRSPACPIEPEGRGRHLLAQQHIWFDVTNSQQRQRRKEQRDQQPDDKSLCCRSRSHAVRHVGWKT